MTDAGWIILGAALGVAVIAAAVILLSAPAAKGLIKKVWDAIKGFFASAYSKAKGALKGPVAGFEYDASQDIFYSSMNAWQKKLGYCALYDEAAPAMSMIMDCEPVRFEYGGKRWLVEFWKGQYGMTTGCEIGAYNTGGPDIRIPGVFDGTLYMAAQPGEMPYMSYTLYKNGEELFSRSGVHWWLTGFKLGEFSQPDELTVRVTLGFRDRAMTRAFLIGFYEAGYDTGDAVVFGNTVRFEFAAPRTKQPLTRTKIIEDAVQEHNRKLCESFQKLTEGQGSAQSKLEALRLADRGMYDKALSFAGFGAERRLYRILSRFGGR